MAAAMALRLQQERRIFHSHRFPRLFFSSSSSSSSSSNSDDKATINDDENKSSASSIFSDIKSRLRQHSPPPPPRRPYLYSSPPPERPTKLASLDEIRKNLEEFRSSSAAPDPHKKPSSPLTSFQEIYNTTYGSRSENPDGENAETLSLDAIRESLRRIPKSESPIFNRFRGPRTVNPTLLNSLKDGLNVRKEEGASLGSAPLAIFRKELEERERIEMDSSSSSSSSSSQTEFLRAYSHKELGERLRSLRPEKAKSTKNWFSLEELSERLKELRKIHEKESRGGYFSSLRESLHQIKEADDRKKQASIRSPLSIFSPLLGLPAQPYLALPPKEQLVEKYFHPDNMSSAEKLKLELKKVRDEFKMSESDCGSSRVQIAQLTTKIKHLSTALHKKDKHSRKGLQEMVQRRKKLLKYLRRTDWDSYTFVLSKLGLRDNPDYKH